MSLDKNAENTDESIIHQTKNTDSAETHIENQKVDEQENVVEENIHSSAQSNAEQSDNIEITQMDVRSENMPSTSNNLDETNDNEDQQETETQEELSLIERLANMPPFLITIITSIIATSIFVFFSIIIHSYIQQIDEQKKALQQMKGQNATSSTHSENKSLDSPPLAMPLEKNKLANINLANQASLILMDDYLNLEWQGKTSKPQQIWSLLTGKGNKQCAKLIFTNNIHFRPLVVNINKQGNYQARFSPFDTKNLILTLTQHKNMTICSKKFDLTRVKSALVRTSDFANYLK